MNLDDAPISAPQRQRTLALFAIVSLVLFAPLTRGQTATSTTPPSENDPPATDVAASAADDEPIRAPGGILVYPSKRTIECRAVSCLEAGWLEQIACAPNSREHESLVVVQARPSEIHTALLMAGLKNGSPGRWTYADDELSFAPPVGDQVDVLVRYADREGKQLEHSIRDWIVDARGRHEFPEHPWVFGGSSFAPNPQWMGPGEHYVADMTGSVIGLVTFGDEVIGFSKVISDQEAVHPPQWQIAMSKVPPRGAEVTLILRKIEPKKAGVVRDKAADTKDDDDAESLEPPSDGQTSDAGGVQNR